MKLGKWVKETRKKRKLTQVSVAEKLEVAQSTVCRIERGEMEPTVGNMRGFFRLYKTPQREIVKIMRGCHE